MVQNMGWGVVDGEETGGKGVRREAAEARRDQSRGENIPTDSTSREGLSTIKLTAGRVGKRRGQRERHASQRQREGGGTEARSRSV